jgi:hypothetical protein
MGQDVIIQTADVPEGYCATSFREAWAFGVSLLSAQTSGNSTTFNFGPDTPVPDDQDKPWLKTDSANLPERWYAFSNGAWVSRHPLPAGSVIMYEGSEASIETFDGGEAGAITATTGPMWEKVSSMNGRMPIGPGTLPSTTVLNVGDQGGEEEHELVPEETPLHSHNIKYNNVHDLQVSSDKDRIAFSDTGTQTVETSEVGGNIDGDTEPHNNLPPYTAIFFIRRTARTHYRI